ncbi:hypothetical protein Tcan_06068 [Toxocara canis]|uniref:FIP-RBD domain-containing protein n=1 Tax=Toxocara canis TaxID=6265 RepID=A0A0B2UP91_TOXCA|nr:hypothetical protein Tcan_06068 [Toxocara canis]
MEPNNLVVTVLSARGLSLKGHSKIDAYVNLSLNGPGSWKSKVQTDIRRTTGDCVWDQRCEFVVYGLDSIITITVYHKTVLGTSESIGVLEFPLRAQYERQAPMWFRLRKKNKTAGSTALDTLKRKMHIGKKRDRDGEAASIAAFPHNSGRGSPFAEGINFNTSRRSLQMNDLDRAGLIIPPVKIRQEASMLTGRSTPTVTTIEPLVEEPLHGFCSNAGSSFSVHNSRTSSPVSLSDGDDCASTPGRPLSTTSSGFGSVRSALGVNDTFNKLRQSPLIDRPYSCVTSLITRNKSIKDAKKPSYEELEKLVNEMQAEIANREAREKDLKEYIGVLLSRIMEQNPNLLESVTATPQHR